MSIQVRINTDLAARVTGLAKDQRRSFANMVEVLLLEALGGEVGEPLNWEPARSQSVQARVQDVPMVRPHFRRDRPAVQCDERIVEGEVCSVCGAVG